MKIHERTKHISYAIRDVVVPARELEKQGYKILKLNIGDPNRYDFDTPQFLKDSMCKAVQEGNNYYADSEGIQEVRESIAAREKKYKNVIVEPNNILPTSGCSEAISMLIGSLVGIGDEVLLPGPTYPLYNSLTNYFGGKAIEYKTNEENGWQPDLDDLEQKISTKTKALVVINPNNPTGALYSKKTLQKITELAINHNLLIISDEIYDMLVFEKEFTSLGTISKDLKLVILGGLSKVYLSPGWRSGYIVFKAPENTLDELKEACLSLSRARLSTNTPAQLAMKTAMEHSHDHIKETLKKLKERRDFSVKRINEIPGLSVYKPEGALYMFPRIETDKWKDDKKFVLELLHKKHVLCVYGSGFGNYGKEHFRTVFLPPMHILEESFERIEEFMRETS